MFSIRYKGLAQALLAITMVLAGVEAWAGPSGGINYLPYENITKDSAGIFTSLNKRKVQFYFQFTCPFCRESHQIVRDWSKTLPESVGFEFVPVMSSPADAGISVAYYSAVAAARTTEELHAFMDAAYGEIQDGGRDVNDEATYLEAGRQVGLNLEEFHKAWLSPATKDKAMEALKQSRAFGIKGVPTVVVAGKFRSYPGLVNGDYGVFFQLVNGLISQEIGTE